MGDLGDRKRDLENRISQLESDLYELRKRLRAVENEMQHEAIDNLDQYLLEVDGKYEDMKFLWGAVIDEVRQMLRKTEDTD